MRFRDVLKFSVELFLPEKAVLAVERLARERPAEAAPKLRERSAPTNGEIGRSKNNARRIIEDLDNSRFGGPSFGSQTIDLMSLALEEEQSLRAQPLTDDYARAIAAAILKVAATGERDPVRLRTLAMSALESDGAHAVEPPSTATPDQR
jgi:hypothetical protein